MNERGHVVNAVCLGVGIGVLLEPSLTLTTLESVLVVGVPVLLGALLPDVDTSFGTHRKHGHNLLVLGGALAFPILWGNLAWVWLGILTHYVLDLLGNVRGMALFYPYPKFYDVPVGVPVDSRWADVVTLVVTGFELTIAAGIVLGLQQGTFSLPPEAVAIGQQLV